eukprot:5309358-Prymnesium_polylepis.1
MTGIPYTALHLSMHACANTSCAYAGGMACANLSNGMWWGSTPIACAASFSVNPEGAEPWIGNRFPSQQS